MSTDYPYETQGCNTEAAIRAGIAIAQPNPLIDPEARFFTHVVPKDAKVEVHDLTELEQKLADYPHRKTGTVHVHDATSFIEYIAKHQLAGTEVWADQARRNLVGVINAGRDSDNAYVEGVAGHGDHRVVLELLHSEEWKTWTGKDKVWLEQADFAEHLEDNAINVIDPDAATMLEIAEHFQATRTADIKAGTRLANGIVQFRYEENENAAAGPAGDMEIPTLFTILLSPFVGAEPVAVQARFRYRIRSGKLALSYALLNPDHIARGVFTEIVDNVDGTIDPPVFRGRPA